MPLIRHLCTHNTPRNARVVLFAIVSLSVAQDFHSPNPRIDYKTACDCSRLTPNSMAEVQEG